MIFDLSLFIAIVGALICVVAIVLGDGPLRVSGLMVGACLLLDFLSEINTPALSPTVMTWIDGLCAAALALLLCTTDLRVWLIPTLGAQSVLAILDGVAVVMDGRHLPLYFRGVNLIHSILLLSISTGIVSTFRGRRRLGELGS